jgi:protein-L-isoaspartate(D-aspartate) O-methyltransferase
MRKARTPDADPRRLYHDILVAIDRKQGLNNGQPGFWAFLLDHLDIRRGERVLQVGAGTGYYTAILAELVCRRGRVVAVEYDRGLARRTRANLKPWPQAAIVHGDGATHPARVWLDRLKPGGRLLLPLTGSNGFGFMLLAERRRAGFAARAVSRVGIFPCAGGRDEAHPDLLARRVISGSDSRKN